MRRTYKSKARLFAWYTGISGTVVAGIVARVEADMVCGGGASQLWTRRTQLQVTIRATVCEAAPIANCVHGLSLIMWIHVCKILVNSNATIGCGWVQRACLFIVREI